MDSYVKREFYHANIQTLGIDKVVGKKVELLNKSITGKKVSRYRKFK